MLPCAAENALRLRAAGRDWRLLRPADLESLWDALGQATPEGERPPEQCDDLIPYWVELWPSARALADWLLERAEDIKGRPCLDLGCGLGLTALVGADLGARVLAVDYMEEALRFARLNEQENALASGRAERRDAAWAVMDWRAPAFKSGSFAFIWAADIMYERRFAAHLPACLDYALAPGGRAWLADPGRNAWTDFAGALLRRGRRLTKLRTTALAPESGRPAALINLWELT